MVDGGPEFGQEFVAAAAEMGIQTYVVNSRAPWENGVAERHGGLAKRHLTLARDGLGHISAGELEQLIAECVAAKNRFSNRSGFSPQQRVFGMNHRLPTELTSDEQVLVGPLERNGTRSMQRTMGTKTGSCCSSDETRCPRSGGQGNKRGGPSSATFREGRFGLRLGSLQLGISSAGLARGEC